MVQLFVGKLSQPNSCVYQCSWVHDEKPSKVRKYTCLSRAWRVLLDAKGVGRISFHAFCDAARSAHIAKYGNKSTNIDQHVATLSNTQRTYDKHWKVYTAIKQ